jgi:hypothetical protein
MPNYINCLPILLFSPPRCKILAKQYILRWTPLHFFFVQSLIIFFFASIVSQTLFFWGGIQRICQIK